MKLSRILPFARELLAKALAEGDIAVDATLGNGHDCIYLAGLVGSAGHVYGFDVQKTALEKTAENLNKHALKGRTTLFLSGHEHVKELLPDSSFGKVKGAVFNLGYLPGGDKSIVTTPVTTIQAIEQLLEIMAPEGIIVIVIYHGHAEGALEKDKLLTYLGSLPQEQAHVLQYGFINQINNPPFIIAVEKK
ncbi:tRNA (mnm(5)s(2)U34)-methyltransferase [Peribacillus kribbensis]|uniref:tRNA (mnm(5)s(2)U34)-methyltransferase n=1 Tax=Peribacillus kribbensis TaxID=356658 RepID=UPI00042628A0|nr:class I SAM-dependent methyltransferase [Peribacillus kribbensis]